MKKALMKGPVQRLGFTAASTLTEAQNRAVAGFIYDNKLETPEWFEEHLENQHGRKWK